MNCLKSGINIMWFGVLHKTLPGSRYKFAGTRNIFNPASLKIDEFNKSRAVTYKNTQNPENFKNEIKTTLETNTDYLIFSKDLKKLIKLIDTDEELLLLEKVLIKYFSLITDLKFQKYDFAPEVMRLHYVLNKPVEAFALLKNEKTSVMFESVPAFIILSDLLFKNKMYEEVLEVFKIYNDKIGCSTIMPSNLIILYFGACYKLNTKESLIEAKETWNKILSFGIKFPFRAKWFMAMLAVLQNQYFPAVEILEHESTSVAFNIKLLAFSKAARYEDTLNELENCVSKGNIFGPTYVYNEVFKCLEEEFSKSNPEQIKRFQGLTEIIISSKFLKDETLDGNICREITFRGFKKQKISANELKK